MKKLAKMLRAAGVSAIHIERHEVWIEYEKAKKNGARLTWCPVGEWHLTAASPRGTISVVHVDSLHRMGTYIFEASLVGGEGLLGDCERFGTREEMCRFVCQHLARPSDLIIDAWRDKHGR